MFRPLRLGMTALYLLAALGLLLIVGGGTYQLLDRYFQSSTDLALQHRMAEEFRDRDVAVPTALDAGEREWYAGSGRGEPPPTRPSGDGDADDTPWSRAGDDMGENFDAALAAIFVLPLDAQGKLLREQAVAIPPLAPDGAAAAAALANGSDRRTVQLASGLRVRLLSYPIAAGDGLAVLQVGRSLADQDRVLAQILTGLIWLGGVGALLIGLASWWLAGRAIRPAQLAWERQRSFIANAGHELRTPLTLLRATTEVIQRELPAGDGDGRALLGDMLQECDHMSRLVDELLLLSRLDAGQLALRREPLAARDLLADLQRQVGRLAAERGLRLELQDAAGSVLADPERLRQVLLILLDNALRHTPAGGSIALSAARQGNYLALNVVDSGTGIAPEHLPHVFERFYRADPARGVSGSGLGLSIARELIEAQHGRITISSNPGSGTRVTLLLPAS